MNPSPDTIEQQARRAADAVLRGGVIVYPTDTIWGIGCDATNPQAVERVFALKKRAESKSLIVLVGSEDGLLWEDVVYRQDEWMVEFETELLLHMLAASLPPREMRIIHMKIRGDRMHDIAKAEHLTFQQINGLLQNAYPAIVRIIQG